MEEVPDILQVSTCLVVEEVGHLRWGKIIKLHQMVATAALVQHLLSAAHL
jgi:hypothetical protein